MVFVPVPDGIIEIKFIPGASHGRRPKVFAQRRIGPNQGAAGKLPLHEISRLQQRKDFADGLAPGLEVARADGVIDLLMFPHEGIGKIAAINRVDVSLFRCRR